MVNVVFGEMLIVMLLDVFFVFLDEKMDFFVDVECVGVVVWEVLGKMMWGRAAAKAAKAVTTAMASDDDVVWLKVERDVVKVWVMEEVER